MSIKINRHLGAVLATIAIFIAITVALFGCVSEKALPLSFDTIPDSRHTRKPTAKLPSPAVSPKSTADKWKTYQDAVWNFSFSYPQEWDLNVNKQDPPELFISIFDKTAQQEFNQGALSIVNGAIVQFSLTASSGKVENPEQFLHSLIDIIDPKEPGLFSDPNATLERDRYITRQGTEGLRGSVRSSDVLHERFVFLQTTQEKAVTGVVELIVYRPLDPDREHRLLSAFSHIVNSLQFHPIN